MAWSSTIRAEPAIRLKERLSSSPKRRTIFGALAKDFTPARLEAACERALVLKACSYRAVRTLLQTPPSPPSSPALDLAHENVRGAEYFQ